MSDFPKLARIKQDDENMEKMHCAARRGQTELIRRLISLGIDPQIHNKFGCTALHLSCKHGQIGATRELAPLSDLSQSWHGQKPLHLAVLSGNQEVLKLLVAAAKEQGKPVEAFLNECDEYEVNEVGENERHLVGQTALHWCVGLGSKGLPMLNSLLALGASPVSKDKSGETPIMRAIDLNNEEAFNELMSNSSNIRLDSCDKQGRTALHWALYCNRPSFAEKLLSAGHEANAEDQQKRTPLMLAAEGGMTKILDTVLDLVEPFSIQNASFHNGSAVLPERIVWQPWVDSESVKLDIQKLLQKKLDFIVKGASSKSAGLNQTTTSVRTNPGITLAPSAPVKK